MIRYYRVETDGRDRSLGASEHVFALLAGLTITHGPSSQLERLDSSSLTD